MSRQKQVEVCSLFFTRVYNEKKTQVYLFRVAALQMITNGKREEQRQLAM